MHTISPSFIREILSAAATDGVLSLAGGLPREDLFPTTAFADAVATAVAREGHRILQYAETPGDLRLREWIARRMTSTHGMPTSAEQVMITTGSQQALDLVAKLFSDRPVAVENPGYLGAAMAFAANRVETVPVDRIGDALDRIDTAALVRAIDGGAAVFYGMSRFQNPTGASWSAEGRRQLVELLETRGVWFVEDDPYGELRFDADAEADADADAADADAATSARIDRGLHTPVAADAPDRTIYCGSFSKSVAPSLRLGFVRAPVEIVRELGRLKQAADLHSSGILQAALVTMLTSGPFDLDQHLRRVRAAYRVQRDALHRAVATHLPDATVGVEPAGGMFLWIDLPESTSALFERAIARGVAFVPGVHFRADGGDTGMRLNFSCLDPAQIETAVARIAAAREDAAP